jgi:cytochrome c5
MHRHFRTAVTAAVLTLSASAAIGAEPSPLAAGKALYETTCVTCHALERSLAVQSDRAGWEARIKRMVANGAKISDAQAGQIVGYLAAKSAFETKCNTCHDLQRPLAAIKNPEQWKTTVQRMAAMKAGHLTDADAGAITLYLSLATPAAPAAPAAPRYK